MDPAECVHPAFVHDGTTDDLRAVLAAFDGVGGVEHIHVGATCTECGEAATAFYTLTHYEVYEGDGSLPVEVRADDGEPEALVTFYPQVWVDERAVTADEPTATFLVPLEDATEDGQLFEDDSRQSDVLKDHPAAPEWVREWTGPFYCTVSEVR